MTHWYFAPVADLMLTWLVWWALLVIAIGAVAIVLTVIIGDDPASTHRSADARGEPTGGSPGNGPGNDSR